MEIRARGVIAVVGLYHDEVEASLQYACSPRDPLGEFLTGGITARALRVLVSHLPPDSPASIALRDHDWSTTDWLLWDIDSQGRALNNMIGNLFRDEKQSATELVLIPTPSQPLSVEEQLEAEAEERARERVRNELGATASRIFAN